MYVCVCVRVKVCVSFYIVCKYGVFFLIYKFSDYPTH